MTIIILLILLGLLLGVIEILLLPGITIAGIGALGAYAFATVRAFRDFGTTGGVITIAAILVLSVIVLALCLRAKTWRRFTLKDNISGTSLEIPQEAGVKIGDKGVTITRLAPMGKVSIGGNTYEAKSIDAYVDQRKEIEVVGFENTNVVVKLTE